MGNSEDFNMADLGDRAGASGARWLNVSHQPLASVIKNVIKMYFTLLLNSTNAPFKGNNWCSISRGREELGGQEPIWEGHDHGNTFSKDFRAFSLHPFLLSLLAHMCLGTSAICLGMLSHAGVLPGIPSCWDGLLVYPFSVFLLKSPHFGIWETCDSKHGLWSHADLAWMHDFTYSVSVFLDLWNGLNSHSMERCKWDHSCGTTSLGPAQSGASTFSSRTTGVWLLLCPHTAVDIGIFVPSGLVIAHRK